MRRQTWFTVLILSFLLLADAEKTSFGDIASKLFDILEDTSEEDVAERLVDSSTKDDVSEDDEDAESPFAGQQLSESNDERSIGEHLADLFKDIKEDDMALLNNNEEIVAERGDNDEEIVAERGADDDEIVAKRAALPGNSLGCYIDKHSRDLSAVFQHSSSMTPRTCISICRKKGYRFAGVQFYSQCFCGDTYGKYGKVPDSQCKHPCTGDKAQTCGGTWRNTIYDTQSCCNDIGNSDTVLTKNEYNYIPVPNLNLRKATVKSIRFDVKACNDAHINLLPAGNRPRDKKSYEIVIGGWGNTRSVIREDYQSKQRYSCSTKQYIDCLWYKPFWMSWFGGTIKVGRGKKVGHNVFMHWKDPHPYDIKRVSVSTGWGSTGVWRFYDTCNW